MRHQAGTVLINALVIVLAISAIAAALLTRAETARVRAGAAQGAAQLAMYLDGGQELVPGLLDEVAEGGAVHDGQTWARGDLAVPIDRGAVAVRLTDLQGRLNVNWLRLGDPYFEDLFGQVFEGLGVPRSLVAELSGYVSDSGPGTLSAYLRRDPPVLPRGGPAVTVDQLSEVQGMTPAHFATLRPVLAALPTDTKLNLNTAPDAVLRAAVQPLPAELAAEILASEEPFESMSPLRQRAMQLLETEEIDHLPLRYFNVGSSWFRAALVAELDGAVQRREVLYAVDPTKQPPVRRRFGWAVYD